MVESLQNARLLPHPQVHCSLVPLSRWPIQKLSKQQASFRKAVAKDAACSLLNRCATADDLDTLLQDTRAAELERLARKPWKTDPVDEILFWRNLCTSNKASPLVLETILQRYLHEMQGKFSSSYYHMARMLVRSTLSALLNPHVQGLINVCTLKTQLGQRLQLMGPTHSLQRLSDIGTLVIVPTHQSHMDSLAIAWANYLLGLPHLMYGAGLNLYAHPLAALFLRKLGAYAIDRRKKNVIYLTLLKSYARLALEWGCNSLFYPGGTRSRSGALESQLKLGLLGAALEAQHRQQAESKNGMRHIFIVPAVISYHCVWEAPELIQHHALAQGYAATRGTRGPSRWQCLRQLFTTESSIVVSFGTPMDTAGHRVDDAGHRCNVPHQSAATQALCSPPDLKMHTQRLGYALQKAYRQSYCALSSHLVAFVVFEWLCQGNPERLLRSKAGTDGVSLTCSRTEILSCLGRVVAVLRRAASDGTLRIDHIVAQAETTTILEHGVKHLGVWHARQPLRWRTAQELCVQDLMLLFYYRNRLTGYEFEKHLYQ